MLNEFFTTTDYNNLKVSKDQQNQINKNIEFVKGSDFCKSYYNQADETIMSEIYIKFYQITMFQEDNYNKIRTFLLKGSSSNGPCFYNYNILKIKENKLTQRELNDFLKFLDEEKKKNNINHKIMYKFYPVYNFLYTNPPSGNDINECVSELIN